MKKISSPDPCSVLTSSLPLWSIGVLPGALFEVSRDVISSALGLLDDPDQFPLKSLFPLSLGSDFRLNTIQIILQILKLAGFPRMKFTKL